MEQTQQHAYQCFLRKINKPERLGYKDPDKNVRRTLAISGISLKTDNKPFLVAYTISFRTPISENTTFDLLNDILPTISFEFLPSLTCPHPNFTLDFIKSEIST